MKCLMCERTICNKDWLTKNGCKWCDGDYHRAKLKE